MDFSLSEEEQAVHDLAEQIFTGPATATARVAEVEASASRVDYALWQVLADAGLLGLAIAEQYGGAGRDFTDLCLVLEQQGRAVAPVPLWPTLVLGALPIGEHGSAAQRDRWLPAIASGRCILTGALEGIDLAREVAPVRARGGGDALVLDGRLVSVPVAHLAERIVVPVPSSDGWRLVLLDPNAPGVSRESAITTDRQLHQHLELHEVRVDGSDVMRVGPADVARLLDQATTGVCALALGVSEQAIALTVAHVSTRRQFGREIAAFQAVRMRAADAYTDSEAMRVTLSQAAWLLARAGSVDPATRTAESAATAAAKWWAAEAGHRCLHTALHLHGGIGNDIDYPLHRYFLWSRQLGLTLGGGAQQLERLSALVPSLLDSGA